MARRYYSSTAVPTTLVLSVTDSQTTFSLTASTGFPSSYPFTLLVDEDTAYEELVTVTAALGGNQFTVTRGSDGTTAQSHAGGAAVRHAFSARDLDEPNAHIAAESAVHGLSGTLVGTTDTQTLTNKTLTSPTVNNPTLVLKQSASPTPTVEGDVQWDTDDNKLKVGDGASTKTFSDDSVASGVHGVTGSVVGTTDSQTLTNKTLTSPTITTPTLTLKQSASPAPTAEGDIQWDTDDNRVAVGDGASTLTITPDTGTATLTNKTINSSTVGSSTTFSVQPGNRNAIINGHMAYALRSGGVAVTTDAAYPVDRWFVKKSTSTYAAGLTAHTLGDFSGHPQYHLAVAVTGTAGAGDYVRVGQQIEGVTRFSNESVTVSFWAKASSGTPKIGIEFEQFFGTTGSPSSRKSDITPATVTLSTSWTYYQATLSIPSLSGKTLGTDAFSSYLQLNLWLSAGSTYASRCGSIGQQSATFSISQVQVEAGTVATPFERRDNSATWAQCCRYYEAGQARFDGYTASGGGYTAAVWYKVTKRISPVPTQTNTANSNFGATPSTVGKTFGAAYDTVDGFYSYRVSTGTGSSSFAETWIADAEFTPA